MGTRKLSKVGDPQRIGALAVKSASSAGPITFHQIASTSGNEPKRMFVGHIDTVEYGYISGWILDLNAPGTTLQLEVVEANSSQVLGSGDTGIARQDVTMIYDGADTPGFRISFNPEDLSKGRMTLLVRVCSTDFTLPPVAALASPKTITLDLTPRGRDDLSNSASVIKALQGNTAALVALNNNVRLRAKVDPGIANVLFINGAEGSSSELFRTYAAARAVRELGYTALIFSVNDIPYLHTQNVLACVFVRVAKSAVVDGFVRKLKREKIKILSDFDDLVTRPSLMHKIDGIRYLTAEERQAYVHGMRQYREMVAASDLVIATTPSLADELRKHAPACVVVPNFPLDEARTAAATFIVKSVIADFTIGYYSGTMTHQADFKECSRAIAAFLRRYKDARFRIVGSLDLAEFPEFRDLSEQIDCVDFMPYAEMVVDIATRCSVTIAPLEVGNEFCEAKSELKFFDAALSGTPVLASPTRTFASAITHDTDGLLCCTPAEWLSALEQCYLDPAFILKLGVRARATVAEKYSFARQVAAYREAFEAAAVPKTKFDVPDSKNKVPARAPKLPAAPRSKPEKKLAVLLPDIMIGSGGHRKALMFCREYARRGGEVEVCFVSERSDAELRSIVETYYFPDCGTVRAYRGMQPDCDVGIATSWPTAYEVAEWRDAKETFYFVQDYEPLFTPMSTQHAQAMYSYKLGLKLVSFGRWNAIKLRNDVGLQSRVIDFGVDHEVYFPQAGRRHKEVLFYARPSQPRRLYELGRAAIDLVRPYLMDWTFTFYGEEIDLEGMMGATSTGRITDLSVLSRMYSQASLGIAFSTTNPSLIPFEMLACGLPVVDVDLGYENADFAGCEALLHAPPVPKALAKLIFKTVSDPVHLANLSASATAWAGKLPSEEDFATEMLKAIRVL